MQPFNPEHLLVEPFEESQRLKNLRATKAMFEQMGEAAGVAQVEQDIQAELACLRASAPAPTPAPVPAPSVTPGYDLALAMLSQPQSLRRLVMLLARLQLKLPRTRRKWTTP